MIKLRLWMVGTFVLWSLAMIILGAFSFEAFEKTKTTVFSDLFPYILGIAILLLIIEPFWKLFVWIRWQNSYKRQK